MVEERMCHCIGKDKSQGRMRGVNLELRHINHRQSSYIKDPDVIYHVKYKAYLQTKSIWKYHVCDECGFIDDDTIFNTLEEASR